jgi:DNA-binding MarR family transcriptional regulator
MDIPGPQSEIPPCLPRELVSSGLFLLARIGSAAKMEAMESLEREGVGPYAYAVLALLAEGTREAQTTIADSLGLNRSMLVGVLDEMEERGWIERRRHPVDRRRQIVSATAAGRRQLRRFRALAERLEAEGLEPLDEEERATLHGLLLRIATHRDQRYLDVGERAAAR